MIADKLKDSILQFAMQGQLTEQLETDSSVKEFFLQIEIKKKKLVKNRKISGQKDISKISGEEIPFFIPDNWEWTRLSDITYQYGSNSNKVLKRDIFKKGKIPVISQSQEYIEGYSNDEEKILKNPGELVIFGDHSKTLKYVTIDFIIGADGTKIFCPIEINGKYLYYSILYLLINLRTQDYGRHFKFIKDEIIPLPPIEEQERIVTKLEQVLPKIEELKENEIMLKDLEKEFPFKMKDSILKSAMQGKLTERFKTDSDVQQLLVNIEEAKKKLIQGKKMRRQKALPDIADDEIPFDIPDNWRWMRLSDISYQAGGNDNKILKRDILKEGKIPVISQSQNYIEGYSNMEDKILRNPGELVVFGDHSKTLKYVTIDFIIGADGTKIFCPIKINGKYLYYSILNLLINLRTQNYGRHFKFIKDEFIPIAPLEEQERIVSKLDKILPLCDVIEQKI